MNILTWIQKGISMFTQNRLKSGIIFDVETVITDLSFVCDPWRYFAFFGWTNVLLNFGTSEATMFPESKHQQLRESLVGRPGVGPPTYRTVIESQIVVDNNTRTTRQDATRERDRAMICLTPLIWIASHVIAFDPTVRRLFITYMANQLCMPAITAELLKRTRNCENGFFRFTTGIVMTSWNAIVGANPALKNTFYDPDFLRTQGGMEMFVSFIQFLGLRGEQNYVKMVTPSKENLPPIESGFFVTANAYTVGLTHDFLRSACFMTAHSLNEPSFVIMGDAICGTYHYLNSSGREYVGHQLSSFRVRGNATALQWVEHIVLRVIGDQPNSPRVKSSPPLKGNSSAASSEQGVSPDTQRSGSGDTAQRYAFSSMKKQLRNMVRREMFALMKNLNATYIRPPKNRKQVPDNSGFNLNSIGFSPI